MAKQRQCVYRTERSSVCLRHHFFNHDIQQSATISETGRWGWASLQTVSQSSQKRLVQSGKEAEIQIDR